MVEHRLDPHAVQHLWLSLLAVPGSIMFKEDLGIKSAKLVLNSSSVGIARYPVIPESVDCQHSFKLDLSEGASWEFGSLTQHTVDEWVVKDVRMTPPAEVKGDGADANLLKLRLVVTDDRARGMFRHSALRGFKGFSVSYLKALVKLLAVPCDAIPTLEMDLVRLLCRCVLPDLDDVQLAECYSERKGKKSQ